MRHLMYGRHRVVFTVLALALIIVLSVGIVGCSGKAAVSSDPVSAIESLLQLRYERSTDASAYAELIAEPELAIQLAQASAEESSDVPPTPEWDTPYLSMTKGTTAQVVVVWKARDGFAGFPPATRFDLEELDGVWKTVDAQSIEETASIPAEAK
ncbi:MAG: hypothetical protein KJ747_08045 [Actinobacteria bacterium]|nr:hypothetical protein [Actinomycetota bacterium]MCG2807722.1 hypothetical protein [Coriobacteriia bacterium]